MSSPTELVKGRLLRLPAVLAIVPVARSTWWAGKRPGCDKSRVTR